MRIVYKEGKGAYQEPPNLKNRGYMKCNIGTRLTAVVIECIQALRNKSSGGNLP